MPRLHVEVIELPLSPSNRQVPLIRLVSKTGDKELYQMSPLPRPHLLKSINKAKNHTHKYVLITLHLTSYKICTMCGVCVTRHPVVDSGINY